MKKKMHDCTAVELLSGADIPLLCGLSTFSNSYFNVTVVIDSKLHVFETKAVWNLGKPSCGSIVMNSAFTVWVVYSNKNCVYFPPA